MFIANSRADCELAIVKTDLALWDEPKLVHAGPRNPRTAIWIRTSSHVLLLKEHSLQLATFNGLSTSTRRKPTEVIADPLADWEFRIENTGIAPWELKVVGTASRPANRVRTSHVVIKKEHTLRDDRQPQPHRTEARSYRRPPYRLALHANQSF